MFKLSELRDGYSSISGCNSNRIWGGCGKCRSLFCSFGTGPGRSGVFHRPEDKTKLRFAGMENVTGHGLTGNVREDPAAADYYFQYLFMRPGGTIIST